MISRVFNNIWVLILGTCTLVNAQVQKVSGYVQDKQTNLGISGVEIYTKDEGLITRSNSTGFFEFSASSDILELIFFSYNYQVKEFQINNSNAELTIQLDPLTENLQEVEIIAQKRKVFALKRLGEFKGTSIFSGKKNEVILVGETMANLASNNSRQIYAQISGLNIFQNDDGGLQLNIGGRGLDPNRSSNFNTRQNGYDISADVLGYPESYYTPPAESLETIEIIRGAASLQYGTQFGGLVNFVTKTPTAEMPTKLMTRNTVGSNGLFTNYTSIIGSKNKLRYYSYFNFKSGNGFRDNSGFESENFFLRLIYDFNQNSNLALDVTYFTYLSQQAGGLNDTMFEQDPYQSNRSRNWFNVNWLLYNLKYQYEFSSDKTFSINFFGLNAERNAVGFRVNRVDQIDSGDQRDLIVGDFNNFGIESKFLSNYKLLNTQSIFVIGTKLYKSKNTGIQGPGSNNSDADFGLYDTLYPNYANQSNYSFPNLNLALFGENIFKINDKLSITPGFRLEYIKTESDGQYDKIVLDAAQNVIQSDTFYEQRKNERSFLLLGTGISYKPSQTIEFYSNWSQNYRSVTFADISTINPAYAIDPNIEDESGYTFDIGARGLIKDFINFDVNGFYLSYNNKIGFIQRVFDDGNLKALRTNTGNAIIYGIESLVDFNLTQPLSLSKAYRFNLFLNTSLIRSEYTTSSEAGIEGNAVEYVPELNFKTGLKFGYNNFSSYIQYSFLSNQFSDASNAINSNLSGVIGQIPSYGILDVSTSFKFNRFKIETGINNILDNAYFTRRATGYPGPGIIPSPPQNYYLTLQYKF